VAGDREQQPASEQAWRPTARDGTWRLALVPPLRVVCSSSLVRLQAGGRRAAAVGSKRPRPAIRDGRASEAPRARLTAEAADGRARPLAGPWLVGAGDRLGLPAGFPGLTLGGQPVRGDRRRRWLVVTPAAGSVKARRSSPAPPRARGSSPTAGATPLRCRGGRAGSGAGRQTPRPGPWIQRPPRRPSSTALVARVGPQRGQRRPSPGCCPPRHLTPASGPGAAAGWIPPVSGDRPPSPA
jgi:hypothetical protein